MVYALLKAAEGHYRRNCSLAADRSSEIGHDADIIMGNVAGKLGQTELSTSTLGNAASTL
jgi:hypothetical protein